MSNNISKALKNKTDAQLRLLEQDASPIVRESVSGENFISDPNEYSQNLLAGRNIIITISGNDKTINAVMGILAGDNILISMPDEDGKVTIKGTLSGKDINIDDFTGKNGYVLSYDETGDQFILTEASSGGGSLTQATESELGGIKAKAKTTETAEVSIDTATGKLYAPAPDQAANGIPAGGISGQILSKIDGQDYNAQWIDAASGAGGGLIALPSYLVGTLSTSLFAWKGNMFKPDIAHKLYAIGFIGGITSGATYQAAVITKNVDNTIATIIKTPKKTLPNPLSSLTTKCLWLKFEEPIILEVGISYYLLVGRTDASDTFALGIPFNGGTGTENAVPMMGLSHGNSGLIAKANPAIGDVISIFNAHSAGQYFLYEQL